MRLLSTTLFLSICIISVTAQTNNDVSIYPEVGRPCPDFILKNIAYFPSKTATLKDFKGKWLVLDFWNKTCGACIAGFPRMSEMQLKLKGKIQVMSIAIQDKQGEIQPMYAKFRERENLAMPCDFDSSLAKRFDIHACPYIIIIDENGIVKCITTTINLTEMQELLDGKSPILPKAYRTNEDDQKVSYNAKLPFLVNGNGGNGGDFLFRSVLATWNPTKDRQSVPTSIDDDVKVGRFQILGAPLFWLYDYAYFGASSWGASDTLMYGRIVNAPILETRDSTKFNFSYKYGKNLYSYSLIMPPATATKEKLKTAMQRDLETYFGLDARVEVRKCPYWRLVATREAKGKLKSKGGPEFFHGITKASFTAQNWPIHELIDLIRNYNPGIFFDQTGIEGNIDINMDCVLTNLPDVIKALQTNGLDLVQGEKEMQVLVIRDKLTSE